MLIENLERIIRLSKTPGINFRGSHNNTVLYRINIPSKIISTKKQNYKRKNWANWAKKRLKKVIYMRHSDKKHISKSKKHSLNEAHGQKTSLAQKKLVHTAILLFRV